MDEARCSIASLRADEPLAGTAVESVDRWLLLEVNGLWAPKAIESEALTPVVRHTLDRWLEAPRTRLQLIRRPGRPPKRPVFIHVSTAPGRAGASRVELDSLESLAEVDLDSLPAAELQPTCLVCVHGRRDRCCGLQGSAVFRALQAHHVDVWQTSHLGGHRFAACALWLPGGLMYGRLRPDDVDALVASRREGEVGDLERLRGRCALDRPTQAAEIFLRRRLGVQADAGVSWRSTEPDGNGAWHTRFESPEGEQQVRVAKEQTGASRPASCGGEPEPVSRFVELGT